MSNPIADDILMHYGVKRRSGRYPWGSGKEPYQHSGDFLSRVESLKKQGFSEKEICTELGMTSTDYRMQVRNANHQRRQLEAAKARALRDDGLSLNEIAKRMGYKNDSSVRTLLDENISQNKNKARATADILKKAVDEKGVIDVGRYVERELGVSRGVLDEAIFILRTEGYDDVGFGMKQPTDKTRQTNMHVIIDPKTNISVRDLYEDNSLVKSIHEYHSLDGGESYSKVQYPKSIDSDRIFVRYGDKGGSDKDGVIEIRKGVEDLTLGNSHYAQARILVDGTHYLKGMAMYSDDIPDGVDIVFNTNKQSGTPKQDVFKKIKTEDPNNPFGAIVTASGQTTYLDKDGNQQLSAVNKIKSEGDWEKMSKNLSSQFLSKQPLSLMKKQLTKTYEDADAEFHSIMEINNPTIKKYFLKEFSDNCDSAAVHLKAAALPRQTTQVILPLTKIKETEVYAPNYNNGETLALIRYPHGGIFEIPILTVNNNNPSGKSVLGPKVTDAIGIHPSVAARLSGADFDGDQVVAIPLSDKVKIKSIDPNKNSEFRKLQGFDPKTAYSSEGKTGVKFMPKSNVQREMGMISNLITDMTLKGAPDAELVRAVRHSMVVIDAEKHKLDYKRSERDNGIQELKKKWQGYVDENGKEVGGASTLISRHKQDIRVPERQGSPRINSKDKPWYDPSKPEGAYIYKESGRTYIDKKTGKEVRAMTKVMRLNETEDLRTLSSGTPQENLYADYGNKMKALANLARKEYLATGNLTYSPTARKTYSKEVNELEAALKVAEMDAPRQRQANAIANTKIKAILKDNPDMTKKDIQKVAQAIATEARVSVGASNREKKIKITDKQWEAIQAGAISDNKLNKILRYSDPDILRDRATPRTQQTLSVTKINKAKAMQNMGYTRAEIAKSLGVSVSTISNYLNE